MSPSLRARSVATALATTGLAACPSFAQFETQKLTASDPALFEMFGSAVALSDSGRLAAVGVVDDQLPSTGTGSIRIFTRTLDAWVETANVHLAPGLAQDWDNFGSAVAFSGERLLAPSPYGALDSPSYQGRIRVYDETPSGWTTDQTIFSSSAEFGDHFGSVMATSGPWLAVGAPSDDDKGPGSGAAFLFEDQGGTFVEVAALFPPGSGTQERFGSAVAISEDVALVSSPNLGTKGIVRIYEPIGPGSSWVATGRLDPSSIASYSDIGISVALRGDRALASARRLSPSTGMPQGIVFVFERQAGDWVETALLTEPSGPTLAEFGSTVALSDGHAVISSPDNAHGGSLAQGGVNVFEHQPSGTWQHVIAFAASDGGPLDQVASEMAAVGDWVLAGVPRKGALVGAAYLFSLGSIADPYGCGVNPDESLVLLDGSFGLGDSATLGIDNPLGTQSAGSVPFAFLALAPDPALPCGTALPGLGMAGGGSAGELLIDLGPTSLFQSVVGPQWTGPGSPAPIPAAVPFDPALLGLAIHVQGALVDPGPGSAAPIGLTNALRITVGVD